VASGEAIMLGDTPYDVQAARAAGVGCVAFRSGGWQDPDLAGALAVYDDPADLLARFDASPFATAATATRAGASA
jgi:phosphoglycolate phosphatase-like HAD superfamily hydrolase